VKVATHEEIESVLQSGISARRAGRPSEALHRLKEAAALCGPDRGIDRAHVMRELGELARATHDLSAARAHYEEAAALLKGSKHRLMFAHTIRHLGDVHVERRQWPEAEQCFVEALDIYRSHPSPGILDLANAVRAFAVLKTETGQRAEACALWTEAQKLYASEGIAAGVEECRRRTAQLAC
jgi:tetratricopeptide (TPR) repeat protein